MAEKVSVKAFDIKIFTRMMSFARKYKVKFTVAALSTIILALVAAANPYVLGKTYFHVLILFSA